ncbi:MAG: PQQ-dependent sugar dehydrogenase [Phycisphaerales bacterium]|nr:MAG: PQQ-dependent sugar dehydrogenase [Phycisphaerales bacterium]
MRPCRSIAYLAASLSLLIAAPTLAQITATPIATGLSQPVGFYHVPADATRGFIVEQSGRIRIYDMIAGTVLPTPYLDISTIISSGGERGLLGLAFHPDFQSNGFFYINYTNTVGNTVIARYTATTPAANTANPASALILRTITQDFANHNGGHLAFGPDGMLYVAMGDGGSANDPNARAQNNASLLGKILRLDVNDLSATDGDATCIPDNNPFRGAGDPLDEIWAKGMRNPWKFSFDRANGNLWIGDVGQAAFEEIDFQPAVQLANPADGNSTILNAATVAGRNYGWRCMEGNSCTGLSGCICGDTALTGPIHAVSHAGGVCSITGGIVYRGSAIPAIQGQYFYADYCANWVRSFPATGAVPTAGDITDWTSLLTGVGSIVAFGEDLAGEMYIVSIAGTIYKVEPPPPPACGCPCEITAADVLVLSDNFQANSGWALQASSAVDGLWQRGTPVASPSYAFDPTSDSDGSGLCWVTENSDPGSLTTSDVDGGSTVLVSPLFDLITIGGGTPGGDITLCYDYFNNLSIPDGQDGLFLEISSNGAAGPWTRVASHAVSNALAWTPHAVTQADLITAGVSISSTMQLRFLAIDAGTASIVECGVDNFKIYRHIPITDCNTNGIDDTQDILNATSDDCNNNGIPDECDIASGFSEDFDGGPTGIRAAGDIFFNTSCVGCHGPNGTGDVGPNLRNKSRTTIRNRLTFSIPHPGGVFPNATDQDFADLEAYLADAGSRARPDRIPDECQTLPDCDNDGINDGKELELATQIDSDYNGLPDSCECSASPTITTEPIAQSILPGETLNLSIAATSTAPITYQWRKNSANITGETTPSLVILNAQFSDSGLYDATATNVCGTSFSTQVQVVVKCPSDVDDGSATGTPDGGTTIDDLLYFLARFDAGDSAVADLDDGTGTGTPDGGVTIDDLLYYLTRFNLGC